MYLGSWKIDDFLTFPVNTHTYSTGAATDADAVPSYRVYEDETATPILTGSMALLDTTNTTGFYSERIQLTALNGFEVGKTYTIYISATVGTIVHTISHTFQVQAEVALHADWLNGGRLDLLIDAIKAVTDLLPDAGALTSLITHLTDIKGAGWVSEDLVGINAKTTNLPDDPADQSLVIAATDAIITRLAGMEGTGFVSATDSLEAIRDRGDAGWITATPEGPGAIAFVYTLTNLVGGAPIEGAEVWVTTDIGGGNTIANGVTDSFGQVTFMLDPGTYYIWRKKGGYSFDNPDTEIAV